MAQILKSEDRTPDPEIWKEAHPWLLGKFSNEEPEEVRKTLIGIDLWIPIGIGVYP